MWIGVVSVRGADLNPDIFREYDIRGRVEEDLTDEVVRDVGRAFATYMQERGKQRASIARDCRLSSEHFRDLVAEGMVEGGLEVTDIGLVPTGLFYFSLFTLDVDGGIMITASHNPPEFNGFKLTFDKQSLWGDEIQYVGKIMEEGRFVKARGALSEYKDIVDDYYRFLRGNIHLTRQFKVVVDAGNGTGGIIAAPIMREMGQDVVELFCDMDGHFPNHFPDTSVKTNLESLKKTVAAEKADVGIAYDGDADRLGVVDNEGSILWGDYLMLIFVRDILKEHKGAHIVADVKCSKNLFEDVERRGGKPVMWKAGYSLIRQKMKEINAVFGGEMSGHMMFADRFFGYDDGIYASLRFLEVMCRDERPVSEYLKDLPRTYFTPELRVDCPEKIKFDVVRALTEHYGGRFKIIDIDGVRVIFDDGWGLVRSSNTQPMLVLRFEAESESALQRIRAMVEADLSRIMKKISV